MDRDVFISYSSKDKNVADAICTKLETAGIRCWVAPRDVIPGMDWPTSITKGIKASKIMVLVLSRHSNESKHVSNELNLAMNSGLIIIPFKIDSVEPGPGMEYFLANMHWLDAVGGDVCANIEKLKDVVYQILPCDTMQSEAEDNVEIIREVLERYDNVHKESRDIYTQDDSSKPQNETDNADKASEDGGVSGADGTIRDELISEEKSDKKRKKTSFMEAYIMLWKNCFNFSDTTSRAEFWKAVAMNYIFIILSVIVDVIFGATSYILKGYMIASVFAFLSCHVRRLHDTNRSGHWMWLMLTGYGWFVILVFLCMKSEDEGNRYKSPDEI